MKLSEQSIKKICSSVIYKRGMEYYNQGRVHIKNRETNGFTAVVDGEDLYNVRVEVSADGEITDYFCTCPYYETMGVACKHIVAASEERRRELEGGASVNDENERISKLFISDFSRGLETPAELPLKFEIFFSGNGSGCEVKLYVLGKPVNNPEELIECFSCKRPFRLGKNLDYHPDSFTFGASEEAILSILAESYESRPSRFAPYSASNGAVKLGGEGTKRIMPLLPAVDYKLIIDRMDLGRVLIAEENPEILIDISAMFGEITMYVPNYGLALVPDASVFFYEGTVFLTDKAWQKKLLPVYRALSADRRCQITFKGENALAFATYVLPSLESEPGVVCDGLEEYVIKDKPEFTVYIDSDGKSIRSKVKVRYGEISFFLPEALSKTEYIVVRDAEAEKSVMNCFEGFVYSDGYYNATDDGVIFDFITSKINELSELCTVVESDLFNSISVKSIAPVSAYVEYNFSANLLEATPHSSLTDSEIREILLAVKLKEKFYRTNTGDFYDINAISSKMSVFDKLFFDNGVSFAKRTVPEYNMLYLCAAAEGNGENITCSRELSEYVKSVQETKAAVLPELAQKLRPYQVTGADWLKQISSLGFGGILADDMGLG
ncbi:MAG: SNF2 helicase associated domain-containing protein, partial [Clostridia bacterium]|nr:SNF2 helicase associated domain-containing protein [Clostridia bacterium]